MRGRAAIAVVASVAAHLGVFVVALVVVVPAVRGRSEDRVSVALVTSPPREAPRSSADPGGGGVVARPRLARRAPTGGAPPAPDTPGDPAAPAVAVAVAADPAGPPIGGSGAGVDAGVASAAGEGVVAGGAGEGIPGAPAVDVAPAPDGTVVGAAVEAALEYPFLAREEGLEGTARVRFEIDAQGGVRRLEVVASAGDVLDDAAVAAVRRAAPFVTAPGWVEVPVVFRIESSR